MFTYRYLIPIETLKRLEPWLKQNIGYERCLLHDEFEAILDAALTTFESDDEEKKLYLAHNTELTIEEHRIIDWNKNGKSWSINQDQRYEYAMNIGANIVMYCKFYDSKEEEEKNKDKKNTDDIIYCNINDETITVLLQDIHKKASRYHTDINEGYSYDDICYILILITGLYYKSRTSLFYHLHLLPSMPNSVQEDMFKLYEFLHDKNGPLKKKHPKVSIVCGNISVTLKNEYNWWMGILDDYCERQMGLKKLDSKGAPLFEKDDKPRDVQKAYEEFKQTHPHTPGRPSDELFDTLLLSLYKLTFILPGIKFRAKSITYKQVDFILQCLDYLGLPSSNDFEARKALRSKIAYLIKQDKQSCWLDFSTYRQDGDDQVCIR